VEKFSLGESCTLVVQEGDLTRASVDAIVNAANERMLGGGGVDGAIHRAAGPELRSACERVPEVRPGVRCPTGEARITPGFRLTAAHVIHTVGPVYRSPESSAPLLAAAYRSSLDLANESRLRSIAFPAISCGVYGYPLAEAAEVSLGTCRDHAGALAEIYFVLFGEDAYRVWVNAARRMLAL
jgi:O-acetyl-ADP-ribose deacetylase